MSNVIKQMYYRTGVYVCVGGGGGGGCMVLRAGLCVCVCVCVSVCVRACVHAGGRAGGCVCLLATTHDAAQRALDLFIYVASSVGLTVNLDKTKVMAAGYGLTEADRLPLDVAGEVVECVDSFRYLGSLLHTNG